MRKYEMILSTKEPQRKGCLWAKPSGNGFILYLLDGCVWKPLVTVDDKGTSSILDDVAESVSGKVDKAASTVANNFVMFSDNASTIVDSGKKATDFEAAGTAATLIAQAVIGLAGGITYKGTVDASTDLPGEPQNGWQYIATTAFTYGSEEIAVGDYLIYNSATTSWDVIHK